MKTYVMNINIDIVNIILFGCCIYLAYLLYRLCICCYNKILTQYYEIKNQIIIANRAFERFSNSVRDISDRVQNVLPEQQHNAGFLTTIMPLLIQNFAPILGNIVGLFLRRQMDEVIGTVPNRHPMPTALNTLLTNLQAQPLQNQVFPNIEQVFSGINENNIVRQHIESFGSPDASTPHRIPHMESAVDQRDIIMRPINQKISNNTHQHIMLSDNEEIDEQRMLLGKIFNNNENLVPTN